MAIEAAASMHRVARVRGQGNGARPHVRARDRFADTVSAGRDRADVMLVARRWVVQPFTVSAVASPDGGAVRVEQLTRRDHVVGYAQNTSPKWCPTSSQSWVMSISSNGVSNNSRTSRLEQLMVDAGDEAGDIAHHHGTKAL